MNKQTFPDWAPRELVESYYSELSFSTYIKEGNLPCLGSKPDALLEIHRRILTHNECKSAFDIIEKNKVRDGVRRLGYAVDGAYYECANTYKTQAQMRKTFGKAAKKAQALIDEINGDRATHQLAKETVRTYLEFELQKQRHEDGEDYQFFSGHDVGSMPIVGVLAGPDADKSFPDASLAYQTARVVDIARNAHLTDVLAVFQTRLAELEATYTARIKQPLRDDGGLRAALIRAIHDFFMNATNKPHDDAVAVLVTAGLDLDTPLTRDDIRPYTGKKKD